MLYMGNMKRIGLTASEEKSFENVDDRRTRDGLTMDTRIKNITFVKHNVQSKYAKFQLHPNVTLPSPDINRYANYKQDSL